MSEYEVLRGVGEKVMIEHIIHDIDLRDPYQTVKVYPYKDNEGVRGWITAEQAVELGIIKEESRKPQVGDVYVNGDHVREIVHISATNVYYNYITRLRPSDSTPHGDLIDAIKDWGEVQ